MSTETITALSAIASALLGASSINRTIDSTSTINTAPISGGSGIMRTIAGTSKIDLEAV
jgi:hypothetical protein